MAFSFKYEYESEIARMYVAEGRTEGLAQGRVDEAARYSQSPHRRIRGRSLRLTQPYRPKARLMTAMSK